MRFRWLSVLFTIVLSTGLTGTLVAQNTNAGDINGTVTDNTGAAVPGATVTVLNIETGVSKTYVTNDSGVVRLARA